MTKLIPLIFLVGCAFVPLPDLYVPGNANAGYPTTTTGSSVSPMYTPGKGYQCTTDEQCGDEAVCYKATESYVGVCSKVQK